MSVLKKMKIFKSRNYEFSDAFLQELSLKMQEKTFMPEDVISDMSENRKVYFISRGEVKLVVNPDNRVRQPTIIAVLSVSHPINYLH